MPFLFPYRDRRLQAVHAGHLYVHQHYVEVTVAAGLHGGGAVVDHRYLVSIAFEHPQHQALVHFVVLGHQDV